MPDLYRKERRRKRLQQKKEHIPGPTIGKRKKPRRSQHRRSLRPNWDAAASDVTDAGATLEEHIYGDIN